MMITFDKAVLGNFDKAIKEEWLITNGLGGYSSSTIIGCNTRRYHGLLVAPIYDRMQRLVFLSSCDETLIVENKRFDLSTNQFVNVIHPEGFCYLESFFQDPFPRFIYRMGETRIEKKIFMLSGKNTVVILYHLLSSPSSQTCGLVVNPALACRDMHTTAYENTRYNSELEIKDRVIKIKPYEDSPAVYLKHNADEFHQTNTWMRNFKYCMDKNVDLETHEDIFSPGQWTYILREGESCYFCASLDEGFLVDVYGLLEEEEKSKQLLSENIKCDDPVVKQTISCSESFIINKNNSVSVIGGYHWIGQNTREALIGLPGLFLIDKKYTQAQNMLVSLAKCCDMGLIPSQLSEDPEQFPEYNGIDISLWFFYAVGKYVQYTSDYTFVKENLLQILLDIIDYYVKGTRFGVSMDQDGLIICFERGMPLSWIGQYTRPDPCYRWGKLLEINALWYNALKVMEDIIGRFDKKLKIDYNSLSVGVKDNFNKVFWNAQGEYLYDEVHDHEKRQGIFVNQLFALSLPYCVLNKRYAQKVMKNIIKYLYTPFGLRLSPNDKRCFPWLLGPFFSAYKRIYQDSKDSQFEDFYKQFYSTMKKHMQQAGVGTISEYFETVNKNTYQPNGCISYSLSIAEFSRVWFELVNQDKTALSVLD